MSSLLLWLRMALAFIGLAFSALAGDFTTFMMWLLVGVTWIELHITQTDRDSYKHMVEKKEGRLW